MNDPAGSSGNKDRYERDWTQGNMALNLAAITWPVLISQVLRMIGPFIPLYNYHAEQKALNALMHRSLSET